MTYHFVNKLRFITITQKIISLLVIGVHLGSSILLYAESLGNRLLLMRTHEDLSSDMELLVYLFYGFVVIFYLVHNLEYMKLIRLPAFLEGAVFLRRKMPKSMILSNCMWSGSCRWQPTTCLLWKMVSMWSIF